MDRIDEMPCLKMYGDADKKHEHGRVPVDKHIFGRKIKLDKQKLWWGHLRPISHVCTRKALEKPSPDENGDVDSDERIGEPFELFEWEHGVGEIERPVGELEPWLLSHRNCDP